VLGEECVRCGIGPRTQPSKEGVCLDCVIEEWQTAGEPGRLYEYVGVTWTEWSTGTWGPEHT
jgi:hypothetical protein